jgi:hypothetical protein
VADNGRNEKGRLWRVLAAASLVVVVGACSDDDSAGDAASRQDTSTTSTTEATTDADAGTIHDTVPAEAKPILEPVGLQAVADYGDGVTARLTGVESLQVDAFMPGEISGPGVAITVELANGSETPINLDNVAVELVATGDRYATLITTREDTQLTGELEPGGSAEGTYVFTIADEDRSAVTVEVTYAAPKPTALFQGSLAGV